MLRRLCATIVFVVLFSACAGKRVSEMRLADYITGPHPYPPITWVPPDQFKACAILKWYHVLPPGYAYSVPRYVMDIRSNQAVLVLCDGEKYPYALIDADDDNTVLVRSKTVVQPK